MKRTGFRRRWSTNYEWLALILTVFFFGLMLITLVVNGPTWLGITFTSLAVISFISGAIYGMRH